jgi:hypothetical protein
VQKEPPKAFTLGRKPTRPSLVGAGVEADAALSVGDEVPFSPTITSVGDAVFSSVGKAGETVGDDVASSVSGVVLVGSMQ